MTQNTQLPPLPPLFFGEHALYDFIMKDIEPELLSSVVSTLNEKYKGETDEQRRARATRYERAFAAYDQRFEEYKKYWNDTAKNFQRAARQSLESESRATDEESMNALESSFHSHD